MNLVSFVLIVFNGLQAQLNFSDSTQCLFAYPNSVHGLTILLDIGYGKPIYYIHFRFNFLYLLCALMVQIMTPTEFSILIRYYDL